MASVPTATSGGNVGAQCVGVPMRWRVLLIAYMALLPIVVLLIALLLVLVVTLRLKEVSRFLPDIGTRLVPHLRCIVLGFLFLTAHGRKALFPPALPLCLRLETNFHRSPALLLVSRSRFLLRHTDWGRGRREQCSDTFRCYVYVFVCS